MWPYLGWLAACGIALAWWMASRRADREWQQLSKLLDDLSEGRVPGSFVFRHGGRFGKLTFPLERMAREQASLRDQSKREAFHLNTILSSMEEAVMFVDGQHTLRLVNPSFLRLFEVKNEPVGQTVLQTLREAAFEEVVAMVLSTGQAQTRDIELTVVKPPRHFSVYAAPVREQSGEAGVVMIVRDITRLKQLEDVRRDFVANVSHELRTPLSIFHGYVENLLDTPKMSRDMQAEIFSILRKHSLRLNALLEDLLMLARLESRHEKIEKAPLNIAALLRAAETDWAGKLREHQLTLAVEAPDDLPRVDGDVRRLEQVIHNLLANAVKYTEPGGRITLRAGPVGGQMEVRVADTGRGIPPADVPHIFERFYRADKARSREQGGTGLGLSIVKHIVQLHGGTVAAESRYGEGTAIILRLPLVEASG